jgi:hypothetical protein
LKRLTVKASARTVPIPMTTKNGKNQTAAAGPDPLDIIAWGLVNLEKLQALKRVLDRTDFTKQVTLDERQVD